MKQSLLQSIQVIKLMKRREMLNLNSNFEASLHIRERARSMWATKYDSGQHTVIYKVVPHGAKFAHKSKDRRLVVFDVNRRTADCLSLETGEVCEANSFGKLCSHVHAASKRLYATARKTEQKAA